MCGILGIYYKEQSKIFDKNNFSKLLQLLNHRGPDSSGVYQNNNFIFGMKRLSIIDQDNGDQPLASFYNNDYKIIFNGEIYNYLQLKSELEKENFIFKTKSDTEVVLNLYIKYGESCLNKLNGMFSFAIYKASTGEIFIARDRFGKKPLYFSNNNECFIFSSEITPIMQSGLIKSQLNYEAIIDTLSLWYISEPKTIIKNIYQLNPGHYLKINRNNFQVSKWWNHNFKASNLNFKESAAKLEFLIEDSVKLRLNSDVKIATTISGGIDSGLISYFYSKNYKNGEAFTIDFKEKTYSEYELSKISSKKFGLKLHTVDYIESKNQIEDVLKKIDEPLGNASLVASYQIFNFIKKKNIKVVLTGDGGDELFGGYPTYQSEYYYKLFKNLPRPVFNIIKKFISLIPTSSNRISFDYRIKKLLKYIQLTPWESHPHWREALNIKENMNVLNNDIQEQYNEYDPFQAFDESWDQAAKLDNKNKLMFGDFQNYLLNDHLRKIDRSSMLNSVEARSPFLDFRIVNFAFSLKSNHKVDFFNLKKILKYIGKDYLDKKIIKAPKLGLTPPINYWIDSYFKDYIYDSINSKDSLITRIFDKKNLNIILKKHFNKEIDYSRFIWSIITIEQWFENNKRFISLN
jgi:asparagine synthase (glutamine-hydrolysing)